MLRDRERETGERLFVDRAVFVFFRSDEKVLKLDGAYGCLTFEYIKVMNCKLQKGKFYLMLLTSKTQPKSLKIIIIRKAISNLKF